MTIIKIINGDLLDAEENLILHQVNCQGKMNSGVAKSIREKWNRVYLRYMTMVESQNSPKDLLGKVQSVMVEDDTQQFVINMFSQLDYGYDGKRYTNYDALYDCLEQVANVARKNNQSVALPYGLGSDRGGANWNIVYKMIEEAFKNHTKPVMIYNLNGQFHHSFLTETPPNLESQMALQ